MGDWAKSWTHSANGLVWTFHLRGGGKWSDKVPLTAEDAVWTIQTTLKYRSGATSYLASVLDGVSGASAPNANTLVITYSHPVAPALANLEQFFILPKHVWDKHVGKNGGGLKAFLPEQHLPMVSGGPYTITQYQEKGTTVFKPNPYFYGPKSKAAAVTLTYYTNSTSMVADLTAGNVDFVDAVPYTAGSSLKNQHGISLNVQPGDEVTNLGFNSNPKKTKNRELLNPTVKEALEYATPRQQIIKRRLPRVRAPLGEHHVGVVGALGLDQSRRSSRSPTTRPRPARSWTRSGTRADPEACASSRRRAGPTPSRPTR